MSFSKVDVLQVLMHAYKIRHTRHPFCTVHYRDKGDEVSTQPIECSGEFRSDALDVLRELAPLDSNTSVACPGDKSP